MRTSIWALALCVVAGRSLSSPKRLANPTGDRVTLERTTCYGTCVPYSLIIDGDGAVVFDRRDSVGIHRTGTADPSHVRRLLAAIDSLGFFDLPSYSEGSAVCRRAFLTDQSSATVTVAYKGRSHSVDHYLGCQAAPRVLWTVEAMIDSVGHSSHYLDNNPGGPYGATFMRAP
jgi:hypothetical protein